MKEKIIAYQKDKIIKPIIKLNDNEKGRVIVALIPYDGAHITIHKKGNKILQNLWDKRYSSSLTRQYVNVAQKLNYKNPKRQEHYLFQREYIIDGIPLWSHKIDFKNISDRFPPKYKKNSIILEVPSDTFWLTFHFSTNDINIKNAFKISTSLGNVFIMTQYLKSGLQMRDSWKIG